MAGFLFNIGAEQLVLRTTAWGGVCDLHARLVPTADTHVLKDSDVMTNIGSTEATADVAIGDDQLPTKNDTNDRVSYTTTGNITFSAAALAIGECDRMVFYRHVTNDADSIPIAVVDITVVTPNGGDIVVTQPTTDTVLGWFFLQQ